MFSPIAFDDTQFDLDLSEHLDQFPDRPAPASASDEPAEAVTEPDDLVGVVPVGDPWGVPPAADRIPEVEPEPAPVAVVAAVEPPLYATTVEDIPVPWEPSVGGTATSTAAVARAVDPPTSVHSVFAVTPPQGTPVVAPAPVPPAGRVAVGRAPKAARRRRLGVAVLAVVLAAGLVAGGAGLAIATNGGGGEGDAGVAASPGQSVTLPPAGAEADKPEDDVAAPAAGDDAAPDDVVVPPVVEPGAEGATQASEAVQTFLAVRGTEAERAVSSQGGRDELDAAIAAVGPAVPSGDPACSVGATAGTFACVLDTDQGPITFTVGPDVDDPQTSGFEVIGATA